MAQTYTKNYNIDIFSELVSDLQTAYEWHEVQISEDNLTATFFVTESIYFKVFCLNNKYLSVKIGKNNTDLTVNMGGSQEYLLTKITKTSKVFCFSYLGSSSISDIIPTSTLYHIAIGTAVNQLTKEEGKALSFIQQHSQNPSGLIISSDNLTGNLNALIGMATLGSNLSSKITTMQNTFYRNSECIMKDVYVLTSLQFPAISFNDCTLNGKKYYMNGAILLADD